MTAGERIKQLRIKAGMSQVELAIKMDVSKQTLYKYENNIIANIPSDKIEIAANLFNVPPSYLMGWDERGKILNAVTGDFSLIYLNRSEKAMIELYQTLNNVGKKEAYKRVEELTLIEKYTIKERPKKTETKEELNAAHPRKNIIRTYKAQKHDDDIMNDEDF